MQPGLGRGAEQDGCVVNLKIFICQKPKLNDHFFHSPEHFPAAAEAPQAQDGSQAHCYHRVRKSRKLYESSFHWGNIVLS